MNNVLKIPYKRPLIFPYEKVRPEQMRVAKAISDIIDEQKGRSVIVLKADTGFGKTDGALLGALLSNNVHRVFYTAPRKDLQSQAFQSAQKFVNYNDNWTCSWLRGRGNYPCRLKEGEMCDNCASTMYRPCKMKPKIVENYPDDTKKWFETRRGAIKVLPEEVCYYYGKKADVTMRKNNPDISVFTTHYTIAEAMNAKEIFPADFLVLDEGQHVEGLFVNATAVIFDEGTLKYALDEDYPVTCDIEDYTSIREFLRVIREELRIAKERIQGEIKNAITKSILIKMMKRNELCERLSSAISYLLENWDGSNIVVDSPLVRRRRRQINSLRIRFLDISSVFKEFVNEMVTPNGAIVLMSATMPPENDMKRMLGIDDSDFRFYYMKGKSDWDKKNRPVVLMRGHRLNYKNIDEKKVELFPIIKGIVESVVARDMNIIIHTHTNRLKSFLVDAFYGDPLYQRIISHDLEDTFDCTAESAVASFKSSTGKILISASIGEGSSFDDDICRVQLIMKTPYPDFSDPWVKRKSGQDMTFVSREARLNLEQMIGRIIRNSNDTGITIMLDSAVFMVFQRQKPKGFAWDNLIGYSSSQPISAVNIQQVVDNFIDKGKTNILSNVVNADAVQSVVKHNQINATAISGMGAMLKKGR